MTTIVNEKWVADLRNTTCRNSGNKIVFIFDRNGRALQGEIKGMPVDLMSKWAAKGYGERNIRKAVEDAEEVFTRAYFETEIERGERLGDDTMTYFHVSKRS
jgi:hypothetical protein